MKNLRKRVLCIVCSVILAGGVLSSCGEKKNEKVTNIDKSVEVFNSINEDISADRIYDTIEELASEKYLGRLTGTEGNELATEYIKSQFEEIGLESYEKFDGFLHPYDQLVYHHEKAPSMKVIDKDGNTVEEVKFLDDFVTYPRARFKTKGVAKGEIVLADSSKEFDKIKDNLQGKVLVTTYSVLRGTTYHRAVKEGNIPSAIIAMTTGYQGRETFMKYVNMPDEIEIKDIEPDSLYGIIDESGTDVIRRAADKGHTIEYAVSYKDEIKSVNNVVGVIPGSDEELKDEYVFITGHFDHLGDNFDGSYNPGASDNASGTACLIEIARSMMENNIKPKRTVIFTAFNGEENGLKGSRAFVQDSGIDMSKVKVLNIDMVANKIDSPLHIGTVESFEMLKDLKEIADSMELNSIIENDKPYSDHASFEHYGAQAVTFVEIEQTEYHTPDDSIEVIDKEDLKDVVELVLRYISTKI